MPRLCGPIRFTSLLNAIVVAALAHHGSPGAHAETYRFLFLGPTRPVVLEVSFADTSLGIEQTRRKYADGIFQRLDRNGDGKLSPEEAEQIPADGRLRAGGPALGVDWEDLDVDPRDGHVSQEELFRHIDRAMGPRMAVEKLVKQSQTVRLYADLDLNGDGRIDREEVQEGLARLRRFDFDDDETLSVAELQPFPLSVIQAQRQNEADEPSPLMILDGDEAVAEASRRVIAAYGVEQGQKRVLADPAALRIRETIFRRFDTSGDGCLDGDELARYLRLIPGEVTLNVTLTRGRVVAAGTRHAVDSSSRPQLDLGGATVKFAAKNRTYMRYDTVQLLTLYARMLDQDKNGYLDMAEFAAFEAQARRQVSAVFTFEAVDLDGNQQVTLDEINTYFNLEALFGQSRLVATLSDEAETLFDIIDGTAGSRDRRLSLRDFREGSERLLAFDVNGDGALSPGEISSEMQITFGQPEILNVRVQSANMPAARQPVIRPQLSGPLWFRRMDRNQDGDVTWREFLGPREAFDRVDANGDGLITLDEAEAAERWRQAPVTTTEPP